MLICQSLFNCKIESLESKADLFNFSEDKPCAMLVSIARENELVKEEIDPTIYEGAKIKPRKPIKAFTINHVCRCH